MHRVIEYLAGTVATSSSWAEILIPSSLVRFGAKASECGYCGQKSDGVLPIPRLRPDRSQKKQFLCNDDLIDYVPCKWAVPNRQARRPPDVDELVRAAAEPPRQRTA